MFSLRSGTYTGRATKWCDTYKVERAKITTATSRTNAHIVNPSTLGIVGGMRDASSLLNVLESRFDVFSHAVPILKKQLVGGLEVFLPVRFLRFLAHVSAGLNNPCCPVRPCSVCSKNQRLTRQDDWFSSQRVAQRGGVLLIAEAVVTSRRTFLSKRTRAVRRASSARPPPGADCGLPLPIVRSGVQHLYRYGLVENSLRLFYDRDASSRICEGGSNQASNRRDGSGLPVGTEAAPPHSGSGPAWRAGWSPQRGTGRRAAGSRSRSR